VKFGSAYRASPLVKERYAIDEEESGEGAGGYMGSRMHGV
jgi:hypothetical protein